ncbi:MAG: LysM peptidoglycan-binding domain-containing protein, partial [Halothiobacillus sp.]|nr:LysM peptidoglycan-binding domain-containing protein [Halothiobacillus sp.]
MSLDQVKVRLAPEKYYQQAGLSLDGLAGNITFQITSEGKRNYVIVRSKRAITDPILSLLIQINAGDGSQVKEFDFLLDPPVHAERRAMAASQNSFTGNVAAPAKTSRPVQSTSSWIPVANVPDVKMGGSYHVKRGDTLYEIAKTAVADKSVPIRPMMQAIINANPNAFVDGNGNLMKAGSTLKVPERAAVAPVTPATAETGKAASVQSQEAASTEAKPRLQLLSVDPDKEKSAAATPQAAAPAAGTGTGGDKTGVLPAIDAPAAPTADALQQNNEAIASIDAKSEVMSKQISMLNDQLKQVQGLVSQRNQNIEQLQKMIKESNEQTQLLKKQLEAQNNNFWLQWAPYLMGGAGLLIIILLLVAISRGRKREPVESTIYSTTGAVAGAGAVSMATQPKAEAEPRVVAEVAPKAPAVPPASSAPDSKSVIDEARLLISYNLHTQAYE